LLARHFVADGNCILSTPSWERICLSVLGYVTHAHARLTFDVCRRKFVGFFLDQTELISLAKYGAMPLVKLYMQAAGITQIDFHSNIKDDLVRVLGEVRMPCLHHAVSCMACFAGEGDSSHIQQR
jgi:hypothetical protein